MNRKQFTGKEQDKTGLYYFGARYMDPEVGRFTQMDNVAMFAPQALLTDPQLLNLYAYARNNPIIFIDLNGQLPSLAEVKEELKKDAMAIADSTTMAIPGLNDLRDLYENKYGKDLITQEELTQDERDMIAAFVAVPLISGREMRMADEGLEIAEKNINKVIAATKQQIKKLDNAFDNIINKTTRNNASIGNMIAGGHAWSKHQSQFPEFKNQEQFGRFIDNIINGGYDEKRGLSNGRTAYWHGKSGTIVIHDPKSIDAGTAFKRDKKDSYQYFKKL